MAWPPVGPSEVGRRNPGRAPHPSAQDATQSQRNWHAHQSFPENALYYYVCEMFTRLIREYGNTEILDGLFLDIYEPNLKFAIEYDSHTYHFKKEQMDADRQKTPYAGKPEFV
jgi:hypothetical protein